VPPQPSRVENLVARPFQQHLGAEAGGWRVPSGPSHKTCATRAARARIVRASGRGEGGVAGRFWPCRCSAPVACSISVRPLPCRRPACDVSPKCRLCRGHRLGGSRRSTVSPWGSVVARKPGKPRPWQHLDVRCFRRSVPVKGSCRAPSNRTSQRRARGAQAACRTAHRARRIVGSFRGLDPGSSAVSCAGKWGIAAEPLLIARYSDAASAT